MAAADVKYIADQPAEKRALLEQLRSVVTKTLPAATVELKWGVPIYFVGINFFAPPAKLTDPKKKLEGAGSTQRMLKVRTAKDIDATSIARWLKAASAG